MQNYAVVCVNTNRSCQHIPQPGPKIQEVTTHVQPQQAHVTGGGQTSLNVRGEGVGVGEGVGEGMGEG